MTTRTSSGSVEPTYTPPGRPMHASTPGNRRGTGGTLPPEATRFRPGISGNYSGRSVGDGIVRKLILEAFRQSRAKALAAIRRRLENPKYVQDVLELLARLQGEFAKETPDGARGISVIVIRGEGAISPAEFRRSAEARMALEGPVD
jgi:hypothetical protein